MGGFNTLKQKFESATCAMHLESPRGFPAYGVFDGKQWDIYEGSWSNPDPKTNVSTAIAPVVKGAKQIEPCELILRSPQSPDAKAFRKSKECDLDVMDILGGKLDAQGKPIVPDEEKCVIWYASFVAGSKNLPMELEDKTTELLELTDEKAIKFINEFKGVAVQIRDIIFDAKKF